MFPTQKGRGPQKNVGPRRAHSYYLQLSPKLMILDRTLAQVSEQYSGLLYEKLHWVSHEVVGRKVQYLTLVHSHISLAYFFLTRDLVVGAPCWYYALSFSKISISPVASLKQICQGNLDVPRVLTEWCTRTL